MVIACSGRKETIRIIWKTIIGWPVLNHIEIFAACILGPGQMELILVVVSCRLPHQDHHGGRHC